MMSLAWGAATDRGLVRAINEDSLVANPPVFLVADGMGGYRSGDRASAIVAEEFTTGNNIERVTQEWVMQAFTRADTRIRADTDGGTTVVGMAVVQQDSRPYWLIFNIGDSRLYRCSGGVLSQVSVDHSVVQELVDEGRLEAAQARFHPERHIITRAVGSAEKPRPDYWLVPAEAGERLLLCSDGLSGELDSAAIAAIVNRSAAPQEIADALVELALSAGGKDNVTAVVVDVLAVGDDIPGGSTSAGAGPDLLMPDESTRPRDGSISFPAVSAR